MSTSGESSAGPVPPIVALALATVSFVALLIFGLGMLSLILDADVVEAPGLGQIPGIVGVISATSAFALSLWLSLRRMGATLWGALRAGVGCALGYIAGFWIAAVATGADFTVATAVVGRIATSWFGLVMLAAGAVAAWGGIALTRTRGERPRWPWEDEFDE